MKKNYLGKELKLLIISNCKILLILLFIVPSAIGFSQQISASLLCSGGESFVMTNQSLEFAIGEIVTETYQTENNILSQGFIQGTPQEIGINEDFIKNVDIHIFPNPTKNQITVSCKKTPVIIEIIDLQGRKLYTKQNPQQTEMLNLENLQRGIYFLHLVFEGNIPITNRIVKN